MKPHWLRTQKTEWKNDPAFHDAITQAFDPYRVEGVDGLYYRCAFCGRIFSHKQITVCHIKSVGANFELRADPLNLLPADWPDHHKYEIKTERAQKRAIEKVLPGRWALLEAAKRRAYGNPTPPNPIA